MISCSVASVPGLSTTKALTDSPHTSSGTPITAVSSTAACLAIASSTCTE